MKCSKQFATGHGQSHLPSKMIHVPSAEATNVTTPEGVALVVLTLSRRTGEQPTYLKVRMTIAEARSLVRELQGSIDAAQPTEINSPPHLTPE